MSKYILSILIAIAWNSSLFAQTSPSKDEEQRDRMNQLLDDVRDRVRLAGDAATAILKTGEHVSQDGIATADSPAQSKPLLREYLWMSNSTQDMSDQIKESQLSSAIPKLKELDSAYPFMASILAANSLPKELAAVVVVESAGDPTARSHKGALGLWQLMPETARRYGLQVDAHIDERVDPLKSTMAAARYLRDLYTMFGDWALALAAYNGGENRLQTVMKRTGLNSFFELTSKQALPRETRLYVPAVLNLMGSARSQGSR